MAKDSCLARVSYGVAIGGAIGGAIGSIYGTYESIRYKSLQTCSSLKIKIREKSAERSFDALSLVITVFQICCSLLATCNQSLLNIMAGVGSMWPVRRLLHCY